jgi:RNA polymerase sigma factor (sigma-70 family)
MLAEGHSDIITLVEGCKKNDRSSQDSLYHGLYGYAMKICYRYTNQLHESEELVNESFVKFFKHIPQFDSNRQPNTEALLKAWFKRIIINTCIDYLRKHHSMLNGHSLTGEKEILVDPGESGLDKLSYKEIIEAIRLLTPAYRVVFNLFVIEGLSHEEIAAQLNISVGASKSNLSKARHNLRKILMQLTEDYKVYVST